MYKTLTSRLPNIWFCFLFLITNNLFNPLSKTNSSRASSDKTILNAIFAVSRFFFSLLFLKKKKGKYP